MGPERNDRMTGTGRPLSLFRVRRYERNQEPLRTFVRSEYLDERDRAVIRIHIPADYEVKNPLSVGKQATIRREIFDFIEEKAYPVPAHYPLVLRFSGVRDPDAQALIRSAITENYDLLLKDKRIDLRSIFARATVLLIFGVTGLTLSFWLEHRGIGELGYQLLSIFSGFSLYECANDYLLERSAAKIEFLNAGQLATAEIEFE